MHAWNVFLKGDPHPHLVPEANDPTVYAESGLIVFQDDEGQARAVFPINAVAAAVWPASPVGIYPLDQTPKGAWIRNTMPDGTGSWVPYSGPVYGIRE